MFQELGRYGSLVDAHVLVTGGGSGIGAAVVEAFAYQGSRVTFFDKNEEVGAELARRLRDEGLRTRFEVCNISDVNAFQSLIWRLIDEDGPFKVLVSNAGNDDRHQVEDVTVDYWDDRMNVNLRHVFFAAQAVAPSMSESGGGAIVNMGSIAWRLVQGNMPAYVAAKAGIEGLTKGLARDLGMKGIRVNCIAPGWIMTQRQMDLWLTPEAEAELLEAQSLKYKLNPIDVAALALFLASDDARGCSAQTFTVDGGRL